MLQVINIPAIGYLFNKENTLLPDLGGIQQTLGKRTRQRRALMRILFDYYETDRLIVCMDLSNLELLKKFESDRSVTRMFEVQCDFSLDYMISHAMRVGLAGEQTSAETLGRLWPTIRNDINFESDALRDAEFEYLYRMHESATVEETAKELAKFLTVSHEKGGVITEVDYLFKD